jgi:uncharacterized delta-60 repeat protein
MLSPPALALTLALVAGGSVIALAAAGDLDPRFSGNGKVVTYGYGPANDAVVERNGKIVVVGRKDFESGGFGFAVARYQPNGTLDRTFGGDGVVVTRIGDFAEAHSVAVDRRGRIVAAGEGSCRLATCFAVVRYHRDGSLDPSFGGDGISVVRFPRGGSRAYALALQGDGRIVLAGWILIYGDALDDERFAVARLRRGGRLDRSFAGDGRRTVDFGYGDDVAEAVAVQPNGKIVVTGFGTRNLYRTKSDFAVTRLLPAGALDPSFGGDGRVTTDFGHANDYGYGMGLRRNSIVVAGSAGAPHGRSRLAVARYTLRGRLDSGFGGDGRVTTRFARRSSRAMDVVRCGPKLVAVGAKVVNSYSGESDWSVARLTSSGRLDRTFSGNGKVVTSFGTGEDQANAVAVDPSGKVVVAGEVYTTFGVARYLAGC